MKRQDSGHQHVERHYPLIEELRADIMRSFVDMIHDLNEDIVSVIKRGRGLDKSDVAFVILGNSQEDNMRSPSHSLSSASSLDLMKAVTKEGKARKDPYGHGAYTRTDPRTGKQVRVEAKGVKPGEEVTPEKTKVVKEGDIKSSWWADEFNNVKYGPKATDRYTKKLTDEEGKKLYKRLDLIVTGIEDDKLWSELSNAMGVDSRALSTFREVSQKAETANVSPEELFIDNYLKASYLPGIYGFHEMSEEEQRKKAAELWSNLVESFRTMTESDIWRRRAQGILQRKKFESDKIERAVLRQKKIVAGHFTGLMSGDIKEASLQQIGMLHDLGLFTMPNSAAAAMKIQPDEDKARKLIGSMIFDHEAHNRFLKNLDKLTVDQQAAIVCGALVGKCQQETIRSPWADADAFWTADHEDVFNSFRELQRQAGKEYTDGEWAHVMDRCKEAAKHTFQTLQAYNNTQGGFIFRALHHGQTDLKKLFKGKESDRLQKLEDDQRSLMQRAVAAQSDSDIKLDSMFEKGLKNLKANLFNFQKWGINWMSAVKSGILAHDAGLGKTPMTIGLISKLLSEGKIKRGILVLPPALIEQWPKEIENWRPGSKVQVIASKVAVGAEGKVVDVPLADRLLKLKALNRGELDADFVIISAGTFKEMSGEANAELKKHLTAYQDATGKKASKDVIASIVREHGILEHDELVQEARKLEGAIFYDEAHSASQGLKDRNNVSYLIAEEVLKGREYKFGLTATPMVEGPDDLFHLANLFHSGSAGESLAKFSNRIVKFGIVYNDEGEPMRVPVARDRKDLIEAKKSIAPYCFFLRKSDQRVLTEMEKMGKKLPHINAVSQPLTLEGPALELYNACQTIGFDDTHEPYTKGKDWRNDRDQFQHMLATKGEKSADASMRARVQARMQRCAISPKLIDKNYSGPQPKIDATIETIQRHFADPGNSDRPVIIFSSWNDSLQLMHDAVHGAGVPTNLIGTITGDTTHNMRGIIQEAANEGKMKILLVNVKAGGAGLNLQGKIDPKTKKPTGSFRAVFLDKPWTPAEMEQAVGRVWRTGQPKDEVHVHHMFVAGAKHDVRKYEKIQGRVDLIDSLAFADLPDDYLSKNIDDAKKRLAGAFDKEEMKGWTPEQAKAEFVRAGLSTVDTPMDLGQIKALRENFEHTTFGRTLASKTWKKTGDWKIADLHTMNELKFKNKTINEKQYNRRKKSIAVMARNWMKDMGVAANHPVSVYAGDNWGWTSEGEGATTGRKGIIKGKERTRVTTRPPEVKIKPVRPLEVPLRRGPITEAHKFTLAAEHVKKNPYKADSQEWATWEALRRHKPTTMKEAVSVLATWLHEYYADADDPPSMQRCKVGADKWLRQKKMLDRFAKRGMLKVEG